MRVLAFCALFLFGCSSVSKPEAPPANPVAGPDGGAAAETPAAAERPAGEVAERPAETPAERPAGGGEAPASEPVVEEEPVADPCGGKCRAPEQCLTYSGMQQGSVRSACWISCAREECPKGLECVMKHDGPGRVCLKR